MDVTTPPAGQAPFVVAVNHVLASCSTFAEPSVILVSMHSPADAPDATPSKVVGFPTVRRRSLAHGPGRPSLDLDTLGHALAAALAFVALVVLGAKVAAMG